MGDSDNVGKFLIGEPLVQFNNLFLNQGQGRIAAADAESADLQKLIKSSNIGELLLQVNSEFEFF